MADEQVMGAANLIAGHAVAYATAFLDGRHDINQLQANARTLFLDTLGFTQDADTGRILNPVSMLATAMMGAAMARGEARQDRWQQVMGSLVELIRHESRQLARADA
jgi:hypothetical protein